MSEKQLIVDGKILEYEGLFHPKELYTTVDEFFQQHSFDKNEVKNSEHIYKDSKQLEMELRPYKKFSDYVKAEIKIEILAKKLREVEVEYKGLKKKLFHGEIEIKFTSYLITDYENSWETKPFYYLFRTMIDKFIYKSYISNAKTETANITNECFEELRSYLNMHRYN